MKIFRSSKSFIALLLALVLAVGTPVTILAEDTVTEESAPAAESAPAEESAPEEAAQPEGEAQPETSAPAPAAEPALEALEPSQPETSAPAGVAEPLPATPELSQPEAPAPEESAQPETFEQPKAAEPASPAPAEEQPAAEGSAAAEPEATQPAEEQPAATEPEATQPEEAQQPKAGAEPAQGIEPVQGAANPEMAPGSIDANGLTTTIKGVPEDKRQNILDNFSNAIPDKIAAKTPGAVIDESFIDAEKYSVRESGYDQLLCWAATASNMLWISGHAQHAVNPYTNAVFANVDEVFDYFRQNFTDQLGSVGAGLLYFLQGDYPWQGIDGASQLKDENAGTGGLSAGGWDGETVLQEKTNGTENNIFSVVGDMVDKTVGLGISFWDTATSRILGGHAITLVGITEDKNETDFTKRYKGVIVADSDNTTASSAEHTDKTPQERAALAAAANNIYTFYPLVWECIDNMHYWVMEGYSRSGIRVLLDELCWLSDYKEPEEEPAPENQETNDNKEDNNVNIDNNDTQESTQTDAQSNETQQEPVVMEEIDINALKELMIQNNMLVFSTTGTKYRKSLDSEYSLYVRRLDTALLNVYLDGIRLSADGTNFRIIRLPNGLFKIVLSKELLLKLKEGKYTLRLEFDGLESIDSVIEVE